MFFNLIPDNEEKKERLKKLTTNLLSFVNKFTENNNTIGYTILILHYLFIGYIYFFVLSKALTLISFSIILIILICILKVNLYYGGNGCTLVKLERYFFDDKEWYGPPTIFYILFNIPIIEENKYISRNISFTVWTIFLIIFSYKSYHSNLFTKIKSK